MVTQNTVMCMYKLGRVYSEHPALYVDIVIR